MKRYHAVLALLVLAGVTAGAQSSEPPKSSPPVQAPARRPRTGYAASPPPEQPAQRTQPQYSSPIYYQNGYSAAAAPFVVLGDGSILANFGNGYERVLRTCARAPQQQPANVNGNGRDALGRILPPPGIAALQQGSRGQIIGQVPERNIGACYQMDGQGLAQVVRQ